MYVFGILSHMNEQWHVNLKRMCRDLVSQNMDLHTKLQHISTLAQGPTFLDINVKFINTILT